MAYRTYQNKKTGITYVYEANSYWDKERKQARNKQVCIGKLDPETGETIPSKRLNPVQAAITGTAVTATAKIVGLSLLLDNIEAELGLGKILKACFPKMYLQILCMAYYLSMRGEPLSHCESWSKSHTNPYNSTLTSQRISEILKSLSYAEQQTFFAKWCTKVLENDYLCYDITSVSSYGELNEYVKYGYNRDGEKLPQINLALLFAQTSQLPTYYNRLPGNINDVTTLYNLLKIFNFIGSAKLHLVLDKGFTVKRMWMNCLKHDTSLPLKYLCVSGSSKLLMRSKRASKIRGTIGGLAMKSCMHTQSCTLEGKSADAVMCIYITMGMRRRKRPTVLWKNC